MSGLAAFLVKDTSGWVVTAGVPSYKAPVPVKGPKA